MQGDPCRWSVSLSRTREGQSKHKIINVQIDCFSYIARKALKSTNENIPTCTI